MDGMNVQQQRQTLIDISALFYQNLFQEGLEMFMNHVAVLTQIPGNEKWIDPLFHALEEEDYLYAADILCHELAAAIK